MRTIFEGFLNERSGWTVQSTTSLSGCSVGRGQEWQINGNPRTPRQRERGDSDEGTTTSALQPSDVDE